MSFVSFLSLLSLGSLASILPCVILLSPNLRTMYIQFDDWRQQMRHNWNQELTTLLASMHHYGPACLLCFALWKTATDILNLNT